jgi:hypothetical protein
MTHQLATCLQYRFQRLGFENLLDRLGFGDLFGDLVQTVGLSLEVRQRLEDRQRCLAIFAPAGEPPKT